MKCPACQSEISSSAKRCPFCTSELIDYEGAGKNSFGVAFVGGAAFALIFGLIGSIWESGFVAAAIGFVLGFINAWFSGFSGKSVK